MRQARRSRRGALRLRAAVLPLLLAAAPLVSCSPEAGEGDEHGHADEGAEHAGHAGAKTDPHHTAEGRPGCEDDVALPEAALERYGIAVASVRATVLTPTVSAPGHLAFPQGAVARVGCAVAGRISEVRVRSGDAVAAGDTLLVVDSSALGEAQSEYLERRVVATTAGPALELARQALARAQELYTTVQGVALSEVQRREAELRAAERDQEIARASAAAAQSRLLLLGLTEQGVRELEETGKVESRLAVTAPIAGRVVELSAMLGELVGPEKDRLAVVGDLSVLWAIAEVSESRLAEVAVGAAARVQVPALVHPGHAGRVSAIATMLEPATRTAEVRIEVPNPDGTLLPGMFIEVEVESSRAAGAPVLAVPDAAVLTVEGSACVFVPVEAGGSVFCKHEVEVGAPIGANIPVLSGLSEGDLVVVSGAFRLKAEHGKASAQHEH